MQKLPPSSFDLIITSPPYNLAEGMEKKGGLRIGHSGSKWAKQTAGAGRSIGYDEWADDLPYGEYVLWQQKILKECWRLVKPAGAIYYNHKPRIVGGRLRHPLALVGDLPVRQEIVWFRKSGFNASTTFYCPMSERIILIAKTDFRLKSKAVSMVGDVWEISPEINTNHPAPFPLGLPGKILDSTTGKNVLDPFCGSGTTGAACAEYGRDFTGIELSKYWCEYAEKRIARHQGKAVGLPVKQVLSESDKPLFATQ